MSRGAVILSLDVELAWGDRDFRDPANYADALAKTRNVIRDMLALFARYNISATWAVVGHLMLEKAEAVNGKMHPEMPQPKSNFKQSDWYQGVPEGDVNSQPFYYAPDVIDWITSSPVQQELACHTFSHAVIGSAGCTEEVAEAEFRRFKELAALRGLEPSSVVFPRNAPGHLNVLRRLGYRCFRGTNSEWYWLFRRQDGFVRTNRLGRAVRTLLTQALRLMDEKLAVTPPFPAVQKTHGLWELPHSMFFAGFTGASKYVKPAARVNKANKGIAAAAEGGRIFSMWTHPHNLARGFERLFPAFEQICETAAEARDRGEVEIVTMSQACDLLDRGERPDWLKHAR